MRAVQFCAGMCKALSGECAKVHSLKFKEYLQSARQRCLLM